MNHVPEPHTVSIGQFAGFMIRSCELGNSEMFLDAYFADTDNYRRYSCQVI